MPFYGFNLFQLGPPLAGFFLNLLLMGWAIGLLVVGPGAALRHGRGKHRLGGDLRLGAAVRDLLPHRHPARLAATAVLDLSPPAMCFEGMRAVLLDHMVPALAKDYD
jgi:ABC-2 type transport system permease protein